MGNLLAKPVTDKETHTGSIEAEKIDFGLSSMQGWRVHMEDAHIAESSIYATMPSGDKQVLAGHSVFAVFDGHGGTYAAIYSGNNFLRVLSHQPKFIEYAAFCADRQTKEATLEDAEKTEYIRGGSELLEQALKEAFVNLDREIGMACRGQPHQDANSPYHPPQPSTSAATENGAPKSAAATAAAQSQNEAATDTDSGTTACVVMVTPDWIVCANAGDSRSVLSRNTHHANPLSYDHKPDDEGEERRIRAAGGYVTGGRVEGDLAVSRGLGDFRFKSMATVLAGTTGDSATTSDVAMNGDAKDEPADDRPQVAPGDQKVSSVPDIIVQPRNADLDEFIIVACDGIWDVQSNQNCVDSVTKMMDEGESNMGLVAEELLDECLELGSKDNMTAIIVKLAAQNIGDGGGIAARRQAREQKIIDATKQNNAESQQQQQQMEEAPDAADSDAPEASS